VLLLLLLWPPLGLGLLHLLSLRLLLLLSRLLLLRWRRRPCLPGVCASLNV